MKIFTAYILLSFIGIAVLGFSGLINHESLFSQCVTATIPGGMPCHSSEQAGMNVFHAKIFQSFSIATLAAFLGLLAAVYISLLLQTQARQKSTSYYCSLVGFENSSSAHKFTRWLELHQQHPGHAA